MSFTINHQQWRPELDVPYVVAIVSLPEQDDLRLTTNIVNCEPAEVDFGMAVRVTFMEYPDERGNVWLPMFEPAVPGRDAEDVPASEPEATTTGGES